MRTRNGSYRGLRVIQSLGVACLCLFASAAEKLKAARNGKKNEEDLAKELEKKLIEAADNRLIYNDIIK